MWPLVCSAGCPKSVYTFRTTRFVAPCSSSGDSGECGRLPHAAVSSQLRIPSLTPSQLGRGADLASCRTPVLGQTLRMAVNRLASPQDRMVLLRPSLWCARGPNPSDLDTVPGRIVTARSLRVPRSRNRRPLTALGMRNPLAARGCLPLHADTESHFVKACRGRRLQETELSGRHP